MQLSLMPVALRREIFRSLVEVQDQGEPVAHSREIIAKRFELTRKQVRCIEDEGIDREWPPLSEIEEEIAEDEELDDDESEPVADEPVVQPGKLEDDHQAA